MHLYSNPFEVKPNKINIQMCITYILNIKQQSYYSSIQRYSVMAKNIGTLVKYDQRSLWKLICIVNPFDLLFLKL